MKKLLIISTLLLSFGVCYGQDTIVATYKFSQFVDIPHIVFETENGQEIDFGEGRNDFGEFDFMIFNANGEATNENLRGRKFKIVYDYLESEVYDENMQIITIVAPSVINIEARTRGPTSP